MIDESTIEADLLYLLGHRPELGMAAVGEGHRYAAVGKEVNDVAHLWEQSDVLIDDRVPNLPCFGPWLPTPTFVNVLMLFATGIHTASTPSSNCWRVASRVIGSVPRATFQPTQVCIGAD